MTNTKYFDWIIHQQKKNQACGIPSYCTANPIVIEAILEQALRFNDRVLIEATANQVNQLGGYTGMRPAAFRDFVFDIAKRVGFPTEQLILGGDHLGPLVWSDLPEDEAMERAKTLVWEYVYAGFQKIHLDTSMRLGSDDPELPLADSVIAERGVSLFAECEKAYEDLKKLHPSAPYPVYIIGSEVPIPGGIQAEESDISVTTVHAVKKTIDAYKNAFAKRGMEEYFSHIIGLVVQPGVEFGDDEVFYYDPQKTCDLKREIRQLDGIVLEGHSTDFQSPLDLKRMVRDGVAILKVGPALTYALREGLFSLSMMEKELVSEEQQAKFPEVLERAMLTEPNNWEKHYHGTKEELLVKRRYSYSDRCRYYLTVPEVEKATERLIKNMQLVKIPMSMLHQFMPRQYERVQGGQLDNEAYALIKDKIVEVAEQYNYAVKLDYFPSGLRISERNDKL